MASQRSHDSYFEAIPDAMTMKTTMIFRRGIEGYPYPAFEAFFPVCPN